MKRDKAEKTRITMIQQILTSHNISRTLKVEQIYKMDEMEIQNVPN